MLKYQTIQTIPDGIFLFLIFSRNFFIECIVMNWLMVLTNTPKRLNLFPRKFTNRETDGKTDLYVGVWNGQQKLKNEPHFLFSDAWSFFSCGDRKKTELFFKI